jgi:hypothetical protein
MTRTALDRRVLLTPGQKVEAAALRTRGFTRSQAWRRVLTPRQRQVFYDQIRTAERLRYIENPYREIIKRARNIRNSACRRGAKYNAWEFTITENDLDWPTHCPVLPWIELHYPGRYRNDPAGASLDRIDHQKGYVPGGRSGESLLMMICRSAPPQRSGYGREWLSGRPSTNNR